MNKKTHINAGQSILFMIMIILVGLCYLYLFYPPAVSDDPDDGEDRLLKAWNQDLKQCRPENIDEKTGKFLDGPYFHAVYKAESPDGVNWTLGQEPLFPHCSVPGATIRDGRIYLYFVDSTGHYDKLSVAISPDGVEYEKYPVNIEGVLPWYGVDPHPEVVDGKIRLYYAGFFPGKIQEHGGDIFFTESRDGINFGAPVNAAVGEKLCDPDVFPIDNHKWGLLGSVATEASLYLSYDQGRSFHKKPEFYLRDRRSTDTLQDRGRLFIYYSRQGSIYRVTADGEFNLTDDIKVLKDASDPSVIKLADGRYLMFVKKKGNR